MTNWKPIDTAPKDGTLLVLRFTYRDGTNGYAAGFWCETDEDKEDGPHYSFPWKHIDQDVADMVFYDGQKPILAASRDKPGQAPTHWCDFNELMATIGE